MAMIVGKIHVGSGLGNQLHTILMTRILALDKGFEYGYVGIENFKGKSFLDLDWGKSTDLEYHIESPAGKLIIDSKHNLFEENTNYYNPETNFIQDGTVIDGYYQSEQYFSHRLTRVNEWLKVEPIEMPDDTCAIGFRGGEFALFPELFLTRDYWDDAIDIMKNNGIKKFEVHTDDPELAKEFFDNRYPVIHDIGINWRSVRYAKHAIIANSSFYILPRLLKHYDIGEYATTIAPRFWARRNIREWSRPDNFYRSFLYI